MPGGMTKPLRHTGRLGPHSLYAALACLLTVSAWAAVARADLRVVDLFAANLATEVLGLIVTLVLVHRYLERQERALRLHGSMGGVRRAGRALEAMTVAWADLVKGAVTRAPEPLPTELADLFAEDVTAALPYLDASAPEVLAAAAALRDARASLRTVITTYGAGLDPIYLAAIDDLGDDPFLDLFASLGEEPLRNGNRSLRVPRDFRALHFDRLLLAIDGHNRIASDIARLRNRRTAPRRDAYSAPVTLDVDLRVHTDVRPEWWSVDPAAGSLRSPVPERARREPDARPKLEPADDESTAPLAAAGGFVAAIAVPAWK